MAERKGVNSKRKTSSSSQLVPNRRIQETPYQDFSRIRRTILALRDAKGYLTQEDFFVDPSFAPDMSSLTYVYSGDDKYERAVFKRPHEIQKEPILIGIGGVCDEPFPWRQWKLRHWFQAALVAVSLSVRHLEKIIPGYKNLEQSFSKDYTGAFHFNIWRFGEWISIVVDDRLPLLDGRHLFCGPMGSAGELWGALVEKAYAKCKKTFQSIEYGNALDALSDLTGSVCEHYTPDVCPPTNFFRILLKSYLARSMMVCWRNDKRLTTTGFSATSEIQECENKRFLHVITAVTKFPTTDGRLVEMIRLKCPYAEEPKWQGKFSDRDFASWDYVNRDFMERFHPLSKKEDDEYWISTEDFRCNFGGLLVVSSTEPYRTDGLSLTRSFSSAQGVEGWDTQSTFLTAEYGFTNGLRRSSAPKSEIMGGQLLDSDTLGLARRRSSHSSTTPLLSTSLDRSQQQRERRRHSDQWQLASSLNQESVTPAKKTDSKQQASDAKTSHDQSLFIRTCALDSAMQANRMSISDTVNKVLVSMGSTYSSNGRHNPASQTRTHSGRQNRRKSNELQRLAHAQSEAKRIESICNTQDDNTWTETNPQSPARFGAFQENVHFDFDKENLLGSSAFEEQSADPQYSHTTEATTNHLKNSISHSAKGRITKMSFCTSDTSSTPDKKVASVSKAPKSPRRFAEKFFFREKPDVLTDALRSGTSKVQHSASDVPKLLTSRSPLRHEMSTESDVMEKPPKSPRRFGDFFSRDKGDGSGETCFDSFKLSSLLPQAPPGKMRTKSADDAHRGRREQKSPQPFNDGHSRHTVSVVTSGGVSSMKPRNEARGSQRSRSSSDEGDSGDNRFENDYFAEKESDSPSPFSPQNDSLKFFDFLPNSMHSVVSDDTHESSDTQSPAPGSSNTASNLSKSISPSQKARGSFSNKSDSGSAYSSSDISVYIKPALTTLGEGEGTLPKGADFNHVTQTSESRRPHSAPNANTTRHVSSGSLSSLTQGHFRATKADYFRSEGRWRLLLDVRERWTRALQTIFGIKPCCSRSNLELHSHTQRHHFQVTRLECPDELSQPTLQGKRHVIVSLLQDYRHGAPTANSLLVPVGFCLYKSKGTERDDKRHISKFPLIDQVHGQPDVREVNARYDLDPGNYFLVAFPLTESHEGEYLIRVLTEEGLPSKAGCRLA